MKPWHPFTESIELHGRERKTRAWERISRKDAHRQEITAQEILLRLARQPGVVLADEVGMGKTFVALAVAASVALSDNQRRPVVVMVPPSLRLKWPRDFDVFSRECLPPDLAGRLKSASADTGIEFLKLLDDPVRRHKSIIFLTHGAMHAGLGRGIAGGWVKLAVIKRAVHRRKNVGSLRRSLHRRLGDLLEMGFIHHRYPQLWEDLLEAPYAEWLEILHKHGVDPEGDDCAETGDDPVPETVARALERFDSARLEAVLEALYEIPIRDSASYAERLASARRAINDALKEIWRECLRNLHFRLPMLILDEAHHLKNAQTRLASLFQVADAAGDADEIASRGPLGGVFERMLFLTATPFQLGHHELCSVLERFDGICWRKSCAPPSGREGFQKQIAAVREQLDAAQEASLCFDAAWGKLSSGDLIVDGQEFDDSEAWWSAVQAAETRSQQVGYVLACHAGARLKLRAAEQSLRPWVIRHRRPDKLTGEFAGQPRRRRFPGRSILNETVEATEAGLEVSPQALLPFLLAARTAVCMAESRPVFAEGLASSYEAFRCTRQQNAGMDADAESVESINITQAAEWYLVQLESALPLRDHRASAEHPKVRATAERVLAAWQQGEKVVVFCHFIQTGRVLRRVISAKLHELICRLGADKLHCSPKRADMLLRRISRRFEDKRAPLRRACDSEIAELLRTYPRLAQHTSLHDTIRSYVRTSSFLVRFLPLTRRGLRPVAIRRAFRGDTGLTGVLKPFLDFMQQQCTPKECEDYIQAVSKVQTGDMIGREAKSSFQTDELAGQGRRELLLPNVRLVNGSSSPETRQRIMLTFNSPFFPEILITSNVMAEGVDLHRYCRYVIHHDLDWNPSVLEQRTGRLDRIGAKAERCGPINVYLPYVAETQDEKMYRVVMDRERWFSVVMGEKFSVDARTTDKLAQRIPLPASVAKEMAFRLEVLPHS
jgi:ERCC4-related helicase